MADCAHASTDVVKKIKGEEEREREELVRTAGEATA